VSALTSRRAPTTVPDSPTAAEHPEAAPGGLLARFWPALLVAVVVAADQTTKWAAGHGVEGVDYTVNSGVSRDLPRLLDGVVRSVGVGAALDLAGAALLAVLLTVTIRHTRGLVRAGLLLYGAGSAGNLADRLGVSYLTAPAPHPRGVVDLLALGNANVADQALHTGVGVLALAAVLHAAGGSARVVHAAVTAARRARRAWKPAVAVIAAAVGGLWVGTAGQAGELRTARDDARVLEQFVVARGVVIPRCRPHGRVSPLTAGRVVYVCPVRLPDGGRRTLTVTTRTVPGAVPTVTVTTTKEK